MFFVGRRVSHEKAFWPLSKVRYTNTLCDGQLADAALTRSRHLGLSSLILVFLEL